MYSLLVVDDEPVISKYAAEIIRTSDILQNDLLEVISAVSGPEALEIMEHNNIDIVLTDICMPGMTGIALLERIKAKWPNTKVILMSGYDEFQYVQAAIRNNGVDYILKSEGERQFAASVRKAVEELEREMRSDEIMKRAAQNLKLANGILRERILTEMLEGEKHDPESLRKYFAEIEMPLDIDRPVYLIIGKAAASDRTLLTDARLYGIKAFIEEHLRKNMQCISVVYQRRMLWLLQPAKEPDEGMRIMSHTAGQLYSIQRIVREVMDVDVSFSTDQQPFLLQRINIRFEHLNSALSMFPSLATDVILIGSMDFNCDKGKNPDLYPDSLEEARAAIRQLGTLSVYFTDCSRERFFEVFDSLMNTFAVLPPQYDSIRYEAVFALSAGFLSILNNISMDGSIGFIQDIMSNMNRYHDWNEAEAFFRRTAEWIFQARDNENSVGISRLLEFINHYVDEHIGEDLSLSRFSELLHYHPSYLSRVFKQAAGIPFSDYVARIKLEKAKELLCLSGMKISSIAASLGFENISYFTRFFKKHTGSSPQDYRSNQRIQQI